MNRHGVAMDSVVAGRRPTCAPQLPPVMETNTATCTQRRATGLPSVRSRSASPSPTRPVTPSRADISCRRQVQGRRVSGG